MAASSPGITLLDEECIPGETVDIVVSINNNPRIISVSLNVEYDETVFELIEGAGIALLSGQMHTTKKSSPYVLTWENDTSRENYYVNGTVVTLTFKVADDASAGQYTFILKSPVYGIYNYDVENVYFNLDNGTIKVNASHSGNVSEQQQAHTHKMVAVAGYEATCIQQGQLDYWYCTDCNKKYIDKNGTIAVSETIIPIDLTNHGDDIIIKNAKAATETEAGYTGDIYCTACGKKVSSGEDIPVLKAVRIHLIGRIRLLMFLQTLLITMQFNSCMKTVFSKACPPTNLLRIQPCANCHVNGPAGS